MSILDIIGPIMIGPSSSHTAGAVRLAKMASLIFNKPIERAELHLHGSFRDTYKGHGTDKALVGGLLGFSTDDERIRDAWTWAKEAGLSVTIHTTDLGEDVHPNTVRFVLYGHTAGAMTIQGSSVGGGSIRIDEVNGFQVKINGEEHVLILYGLDRPRVISNVTSIIGKYDTNIGTMVVSRKEKGLHNFMTIEIDNKLPQSGMEELRSLENVHDAIYIRPM